MKLFPIRSQLLECLNCRWQNFFPRWMQCWNARVILDRYNVFTLHFSLCINVMQLLVRGMIFTCTMSSDRNLHPWQLKYTKSFFQDNRLYFRAKCFSQTLKTNSGKKCPWFSSRTDD